MESPSGGGSAAGKDEDTWVPLQAVQLEAAAPAPLPPALPPSPALPSQTVQAPACAAPNGTATEGADMAAGTQQHQQERQAGAEARLRIEYFSNREARVLSWMVVVGTLAVLCSAAALVALKFVSDEQQVLFENKTW